MPNAIPNPDSYYYAETALQGQNQAMALGQRGGYTPQEITSLVGADFEAQQQNLITQKGIQQKQQEISLAAHAQAQSVHVQHQQATTQAWESGASLAASTGILGGVANAGAAALATSTGVDLGVTGGTSAVIGSEIGAGVADVAGAVGTGVADIGSWVGGLLAAVTVICTELNRQGLLPDNIYRLDSEYSSKHIDREAYLGYRLWADPVVRLMRKSRLFTRIVKPIALSYCYEAAHRMNPEIKGSWFGGCLIKIGVPACRFIYRIKTHGEVCHV